MRTTLRRDLTAAIKARDRLAVTALRSALAAIENAEAPPVDHASRPVDQGEHIAGSASGLGAAELPRRQLTESDLHAIIEGEVAERARAAANFEHLGRHADAGRLRSEADLLRRYLRPAR